MSVIFRQIRSVAVTRNEEILWAKASVGVICFLNNYVGDDD